MCLRSFSEAGKIRRLYSGSGDRRKGGGGKVEMMYGTGREREIGENVSTLPEGNAGKGEEIRVPFLNPFLLLFFSSLT